MDSIILRTMKFESMSKATLFETNSMILPSFIFFFYVFLKHKHFYFSSGTSWFAFSSKNIHMKIKAINKVQFFTIEFTHTCDDLISYHLNYLCKFYTIPYPTRIHNKSFLCILLTLSGDISLNLGPFCNNQSSLSNEWNIFKSKGIHLIHLNANSLLPKIDKTCYIA